MPFLTLSVFCLPAVTVIANKRPPEQVCIKRTSIAALGWLAWTAFFLFLFPFFASYCPSFSPFFLTFHPHGPAAELTPIACGPDCPLLFYFPILLKTRRPSFILTSHASSSQSPIHFPQFLLLLRRILRLSVLFLFILHFLLIFISTYSFKSSFS